MVGSGESEYWWVGRGLFIIGVLVLDWAHFFGSDWHVYIGCHICVGWTV